MAFSAGALLTGTWTADQLKTLGNAPGVGDHFEGPDGKVYKFVQYDTGAGPVAAVSGNVCYYYAPGGTSAGASLVVTSDLSVSAGLGARVMAPASADGEYCCSAIMG